MGLLLPLHLLHSPSERSGPNMIDDIFGALCGEAVLDGIVNARRSQRVFCVFFGAIGGILGAIGAVHFGGQAGLTTNLALRLSMTALFVFLACFSLFNVGLGRAWRWPGRGFLASLAAIFISRILWGP